MVLFVDLLLIFIATGVFLFVRAGIINECYQKLLQQGEYSDKEKRARYPKMPFGELLCGIVNNQVGRAVTKKVKTENLQDQMM